MAEFLLEIGTEEIPARMLQKAESDLKSAIEALLVDAGLSFQPLESGSAPRQFAVFGRDIQTRQADREETVVGPPVRIAYDGEGKPTKALLGFLNKNPGLDVNELFTEPRDKGEVVAGRVFIEGRNTLDILAEALPGILERMHFGKTMRWGHCPTRFVRPVRCLLAIFGGAVIPFQFGGVASGDQSFGHRFLGPGPFQVRGIDHFSSEKARHGIVVLHQDRLARIQAQIDAHLGAIGGRLVPDEDLLREVTDLVEQPYVVLGSFDPKFLDIPKEILVTSLRDHQKSFTVQDETGKLMPFFLAIANVAEDRHGLIKKGNEWVLNARLWDAKFFWESDLRKDFEALRQRLKQLVFQTSIGSYFQKTDRMVALAEHMAERLGYSESDRKALATATGFSKCDLVSELVFEFPELQGITGGLLLRKKGHDEKVAGAVYEHYLPVSMDDALPATGAGGLLSIADKLDTLVGCFAVGLIPSGAKDPYALRRATQGIVRILIEHELPLSLSDLLDKAIAGYSGVVDLAEDLGERLQTFFIDRMAYYLKREGFEHDLIQAVLARDTDRVDQTLKRAQAIARQQEKPHFRTLALNLKRMNNVVADEEAKLPEFRQDLLVEAPEKDLWQQFQTLRPEIESAAAERRYNRAMDLMTELADAIERYFGTEGVFVNVEDAALRLNRKSMIHQVRLTLGLVADISCLDTK